MQRQVFVKIQLYSISTDQYRQRQTHCDIISITKTIGHRPAGSWTANVDFVQFVNFVDFDI